jgi:DNA-binding beta-propeller fold protein YncE
MRPAAAAAALALLALAAGALTGGAAAADGPPLVREAVIPLPHTGGRIDHMAVDLRRGRLFVAELGNGTVDVVDIAARRVALRIKGLRDPQGVGYSAGADVLAVASAGDGTVRFYRGEDMAPSGVLSLGDDADNIRVDPQSGAVIVGYGSGGLAVIDPASRTKAADIRLPAHPEGFQLDGAGGRAFVNVPDARQVAVVDMRTGETTAAWRPAGLRGNFPLAYSRDDGVVAAVFRSPARLVLLDARTGAVTAALDACGDADDVFFDARRARIYVSCGSGTVDAWQREAGGYQPLPRTETANGARTSLFVPELDRLFVAARAGLLGADASILVFRPAP